MSIVSQPIDRTPEAVLTQALRGQIPEIQPYKALAELNRRVKSRQMMQAQQGQQAMQQAQQLEGQPPVAQQLVQQDNRLRGIAAGPVGNMNFSGGGIVAFDEGGDVPYIPYMPTIEDEARKYGINISIYDPPEIRTKKLQQLKTIKEQLNSRAEIPIGTWLPSNQQLEASALKVPQPTLPNTPPIPIPDVQIAAQQQLQNQPRASQPRASQSVVQQISQPQTPQFNVSAPKFDLPEELTAEQQAEIRSKLKGPALAAFDERMKKYNDYAESLQRGEGVKQFTPTQRGINALLGGATEEIANARRAGVRPSLGMALGMAGRAALASDQAIQDKLQAMKEKGLEYQMSLDKARAAHEAGQDDIAMREIANAQKIKNDILAIKNNQKVADTNVSEKRSEFEQKNWEKSGDWKQRELERQKDLQVANIMTSPKFAAIEARGAGTGGANDEIKIAQIKAKAAADIDKDLAKDVSYLMLKTPAEKEKYRQDRIDLRIRTALNSEGFNVAPTPGSSRAGAGGSPSISDADMALIKKFTGR